MFFWGSKSKRYEPPKGGGGGKGLSLKWGKDNHIKEKFSRKAWKSANSSERKESGTAKNLNKKGGGSVTVTGKNQPKKGGEGSRF